MDSLVIFGKVRDDLGLEHVVSEGEGALDGFGEPGSYIARKRAGIGVRRADEVIEVPYVSRLGLGTAGERLDLLSYRRSGRVVVRGGRGESVGADDVGTNGLQRVLFVSRPTPAELDLRGEGNGDAGGLQLDLPPLRGVRLLRSRDASDLEALGGEHLREWAGEQHLFEPFAKDVGRALDDIEVEVIRVASAAEPRANVHATLDDPVCSVESGFEDAKQTQMEGLDVPDVRPHEDDNHRY